VVEASTRTEAFCIAGDAGNKRPLK